MKNLAVKFDDELHKEFKMYALKHGYTMTALVEKLVKKELQKEKEQTR